MARGRFRAPRRFAPSAPWLLAPLLVLALTGSAPAPTTREALRQGNRLYRSGDLEGAVAAYRAAADPDDPLLAYNLATSLHHLGQLPEAVLWYRRAAAGLGSDPWIEQNLRRARADLGALRLGPPRWVAPALEHPWLPGTLAAACAWGALVAAIAGAAGTSRHPRRLRRAVALLLVCGLALGAGAVALALFGPQPAVLLRACGKIPAGSEVWVAPEGGGRYRVLMSGEACEPGAVGLVEPRRSSRWWAFW